MRIVTSAGIMQNLAARWKSERIRVGLVPTMGFLHAGHLSLVQRARRRVGKQGRVVVSIYVNPTQFGPAEDFSRYPRDLARDLKLCSAEGVDVVFAPPDRQMYPGRAEGSYSTYVLEERLSESMEGACRPGHFRGVTTVVAKLFNLVQPEVALFGEKDFQQAAIIRRMVLDLNFPVKILLAPTLREPDGLAMSSRNKYLEGDLRRQAAVLWRAIQEARSMVRGSRGPVGSARLKSDLKKRIQAEPAARVDYIEFFEPRNLTPVKKVRRGIHMALAVFIGRTRLIDNARL